MSDQVDIEISVQDVHQRLDDSQEWLLLDCREQDEYDTACIAGSKLIPMNEIPDRVSEIESFKDKPIVVFCHGGMRSLRVAHFLRQQGFVQSQSMAGGIDAWSREIDPDVPRY